uniref:Uncharacterized protein n=1 Tax=Strongyloides papillosus TaxID=174720 RepID=A0A0N5B3I8_STREA
MQIQTRYRNMSHMDFQKFMEVARKDAKLNEECRRGFTYCSDRMLDSVAENNLRAMLDFFESVVDPVNASDAITFYKDKRKYHLLSISRQSFLEKWLLPITADCAFTSLGIGNVIKLRILRTLFSLSDKEVDMIKSELNMQVQSNPGRYICINEDQCLNILFSGYFEDFYNFFFIPVFAKIDVREVITDE